MLALTTLAFLLPLYFSKMIGSPAGAMIVFLPSFFDILAFRDVIFEREAELVSSGGSFIMRYLYPNMQVMIRSIFVFFFYLIMHVLKLAYYSILTDQRAEIDFPNTTC